MTGRHSSLSELLQMLREVTSRQNNYLCELRLDLIQAELSEIISFLRFLPTDLARKSVITLRRQDSGAMAAGGFVRSWDAWLDFWEQVSSLGPWHALDIDFDLRWTELESSKACLKIIQKNKQQILWSIHASLDDLDREKLNLSTFTKKWGGNNKIATFVKGPGDLLRLASIKSYLEKNAPVVASAMGPAGRAWRWSALAGKVSYFAYEQNLATAPGQEVWTETLKYKYGFPDGIFLLWCQDPNNRYGENRWNQIFSHLKLTYRYVALAAENDCAQFGESALEWMRCAQIKGASVTKPYKLSFGKKSINTIYTSDSSAWNFANTDGLAVLDLLEQNGLRTADVLILGGGGSALAVLETLNQAGFKATLWKRNDNGKLGPPPIGNPQVLISTWPGSESGALVDQLPNFDSLALVVDAQFNLSELEAPLATWAKIRSVPYSHGLEWWRRQARKQAQYFLCKEDRDQIILDAKNFCPSSKSETLRGLALGMVLADPIVLQSPSICDDTNYFRSAISKLGVRIDESGADWILTPPIKLSVPESALNVGESATALRFLASLASVLPSGAMLKLQAAKSLQSRSLGALRQALQCKLSWKNDILEIPTGLAFPAWLALDDTSQVASGYIFALSRRARLSNEPQRLTIGGELRSLPYVSMTIEILRLAGFDCSQSKNASGEIQIEITAPQASLPVDLALDKDESGLAFVEVALRYLEILGPRHTMKNSSKPLVNQGDEIFPKLLQELLTTREYEFSLSETPDLAPPLASAALMFSRKLRVHSTPQLKDKECDRGKAIVQMAKLFGANAELETEGFFIDANSPRKRMDAKPFTTYGDHRIAMSIGLLSIVDAKIKPDNYGCVAKSFPRYWELIEFLKQVWP